VENALEHGICKNIEERFHIFSSLYYLRWLQMNTRHMVGIMGLAALAVSGCAKTRNNIAAQGGFLTSHEAPYIVIKQSGGHITDVYKLNNAIIQSEDGSDGWLFRDNEGTPVHIGGDMKSLRLETTSDPRWAKYCEYHMEFDARPYHEACPQENK
jgi:hypothetical protein